jgi:hypothetical protein
MEFLSELWQPIVLSAVMVFFVSSVVHMVLRYHKSDFKPLPNEERALEALRALNLPPGEYFMPTCAGSMKEMNTPEMKAKFERGPVGWMTVLPNGMPGIGKNLVQWFVYTLVISVFAAYLADVALDPGADYLAVFRYTGTVAVMAYALANVDNSIWKGRSWGTTAKFMFDGVLYGLVTAGVFGWLWPKV